MEHWIDVGKGGGLAGERIIVIARADSAPIRRLMSAVGVGQRIDLTFGRPCRAIVVLDSGHIVEVPLAPQALLERINGNAGEDAARSNITAPPLGSGGIAAADEVIGDSREAQQGKGCRGGAR